MRSRTKLAWIILLTTARPLPVRAVPGIPPSASRCTRSALPLPPGTRSPSPNPSIAAAHGNSHGKPARPGSRSGN